MTVPQLGSLTWLPATERPELLGAPVAAALSLLPGPAWVAEIDGELADTAAFCAAYDVPMAVSANCVVPGRPPSRHASSSPRHGRT